MLSRSCFIFWFVCPSAMLYCQSHSSHQLKMRRKPVKVKVPLGVDCHLQKNPQLIKNVQHCKAEQPPVAGEIVDICASKPTRGDFSLIKRLGSGAYGTVYLAQHNPSGVRVALKAISKVPRGKDGRSCELSEEALEKRVHGIRGKASLDLLDCTLDEFFALLRLRGEKTMLQIHAAFHDLRYWYIATVSQSWNNALYSSDIGRADVSCWWRSRVIAAAAWSSPCKSCAILCCRSGEHHQDIPHSTRAQSVRT